MKKNKIILIILILIFSGAIVIYKGYKVYQTGDRYIYNNTNKKVEDNELIIAIK